MKKIIGKIALGLLALILFIYYGIIPFVMARVAVQSARTELGNPPSGFNEINLTTKDSVKLLAWYHEPQNGKVIIILDGAGGNKSNMQGRFPMLTENGYGVLALDLRGHGESEGKTNKFGWQGTKDIGAAVNFLRSQDNVQSIGALGNSLGGEVLLGAASTYPEIKAIIADGATARSFDEFMNVPFTSHFIQSTSYTRLITFWVKVFTGEQPPKPLLSSIKESGQTRFLFVAAGNNQMEPIYNKAFTEATPSRSELWVAEGVDHTGAFDTYKEEYEQRVLELFSEIR